MGDKSKVTLSIELDELITTSTWTVTRDKIDTGGALGVANGFGDIRIAVNDTHVLTITLAEGADRKVNLEVYEVGNAPVYQFEVGNILLALEEGGIVAPRSGRKS